MKTLTLILFFFSITPLFAQIKKNAPPPPPVLSAEEEERELKNRECIHESKYNAGERAKFYPFSVARRIELVSYDSGYMSAKNIIIVETKVLDDLSVDTLTDILYNNFYKGSFTNLTSSGCYTPRNAILFFNARGKMFAYIEICFECLNFETSSRKVTIGDFCFGKINLLKSFFDKSGIKIGVR